MVDFSPDTAGESGPGQDQKHNVPGDQEEGHSADDDEETDGESVLALIKAMPGNISLESMLREIDKLTAIRAIGLPENLFAAYPPALPA